MREDTIAGKLFHYTKSDHGQTVTDHPLGQGPAVGDPHDLHLRWEEDAHRQVVSVIESANVELRDQTFLAKRSRDHLQSAVIYSPNGGLAYIYARTPSAATNDDGHLWSTPDNEVVRDIAIELWRQSHGEPPRNPDQTYQFTGALGLDPVVLVRQTGAFLDLAGQPYQESYEFVALVGVTPASGGRFFCKLVPLREVEDQPNHSDWIDFSRRILALDDRLLGASPAGTCCGDIILIPDTKAGFNAVHEGDAYPGWLGGPSKADSRVPLAVASEALSIDGGNEVLRGIIDKSRATGSPQQNQDATRVIRKIFEVVK